MCDLTRRELFRAGGAALLTTALGGTVLSLANVSAFAADKPYSDAKAGSTVCPTCGCGANHCDTGYGPHLSCPAATPEQKAAVVKRVAALDAACTAALNSGGQICTKVLGEAAAALGYYKLRDDSQLQGSTTISCVDHLEDIMDSTRMSLDGWERIKADVATNYAAAGWLVIGGLKADDMIHQGAQGLAFVVKGGSFADKWKSINVVYCDRGKKPRVETADHVVDKDDRDSLKLWVLKQVYADGVAQSG